MPKIDEGFVRKIYSDYGQELTPEKLDYINNTYANNDDFKNEFLYKYGSKEQEPVEGKKKTQEVKSNSTSKVKTSESRTPKVNGKPISGGEKPKKTTELASSSGTTWNKQPETVFSDVEKIVQEDKKKKNKATTAPKVDKKPMPVVKAPTPPKIADNKDIKYEYIPEIDAKTGKNVYTYDKDGKLVQSMEKVPVGYGTARDTELLRIETLKKKAEKKIIVSDITKKYKEETKVTEEDINNINSDINSKLNNEGISNKISNFFSWGADVLSNKIAPIIGQEVNMNPGKPYAKEEKQAIDQLIKENKVEDVSQLNPDVVLNRTKEIILKNKKRALREEKIKDFQSKLTPEQSEAINNEEINNWKTLKDKEKFLAIEATLEVDNFENLKRDLIVTKNIIDKKIKDGEGVSEEFANYANKLADQYNQSIEDLTRIENDIIGNVEDIGSAEDEVGYTGRNYSNIDKFKETVKLGFGDMYMNLGLKQELFMGELFENLTPERKDELIDSIIEWENAKESTRGKYSKDVEYEDLSVNNFGGFFMQEFGSQISTIIQMLLPGGIGMIGVGSATDKYGQMATEKNQELFIYEGKEISGYRKEDGTLVDGEGRKYKDNEVKIIPTEKRDLSKENMFLTSTAFGLAESLLGALPTKNILSRSLSAIGRNQAARTLFRSSVMSSLRKKAATKADVVLTEVTSEGATQVVQNVADIMSGKKDVSITDNVGHAAFSGGIISLFMTSAPEIGGMLLKKMSGNESSKKVKENIESILKLREALNDANLSTESVKAIQGQINNLESSNKEIIKKNISRVEKLPAVIIDSIIDLNKKQELLRIQANEIKGDNSLDKDLKVQILEQLKSEFSTLEEKREKLVSNEATILDAIPVNELKKLRKKAIDKLLSDNKNSNEAQFTDNVIDKEAIKIYNEENNISEKTETKEKIYYYNTDPERGVVESKPESIPDGYTRVKEIENSKELDSWRKQKPNEVSILRQEEISEFKEEIENAEEFITDGKIDAKKVEESDNAKAKEIYDKYDAKIKPLLEETKTQDKDAIQKQSTGEISVQPETTISEEVEQGESEAKLEEPTEQSEEKVKLQEDVNKASERLSKAFDAYKNIGIVFDPENNWKKDKELVSSLVEFAVSNIKFGTYNAKILIEDLAKKGIEISKENAKYIFDKANRKFKADINKAVGIKPKATEQKRINKAFAIGVATQKVETKAEKNKTELVKEELSDIKKQLSDLFSSAKEALKITKDRASEIGKLKKGAESFVKSAINGLSSGDIGNRAIKSIVSKINDITDVNFDEKLNEINDILTNLYSKKDVNKAKANRKKAVKNVLSGKVGKLSKDGDRKEVLNSKILNFALLNPSILKKVLDDASFGVYTDAIKALSEKKDAISDTDIKYYEKIYDEVSDKHNKFQDNVNKIQEKINTGDALSVDEQKFFDENQDEFYENESQEDIEEKEEAKRVKKEADIKRKKDGIRAFIPFLNDVFLESDAKKDSLEYRILSAISTLNESDINEMSSAMLTNTLNALNSLVNDDVLVAYADKLHQHIIANNTKRIALESVGRAGKGGLYSNKVSRAFLKARGIINSPIASLMGIGKGKLDLELLKSRTDFMRISSIDAALKIYKDSPIYDNIISTLGKAMSYVSDTQSKAEEMLNTAKVLLDKNSDNVNESYMKVTYFLIDKMSKANQGTTSEVSAMEYFESTLNDPESKIKDNQNHVDALSEFIDKAKKNNGVVELTIDEARAANVIRIVLEENKMDAYEALVFQNENASSMVNEYFPLLNNLKDQTSNDLDKLSARFKTTSTKSSNLEEKTGKAHPIDMNPFSSAFQSVKNTSIQFNLRSEFIGIMRGLNNAIEENNKKQDSKEKRDADMYLYVIKDSIQRNIDLIINGSIYQSSNLSDGFWNYFDKIAYHAMLGSTVSRGVDFAGNLALLGTLDPKLLVMGNKVFDELSKIKGEAESYTDILRKFLKNAEASNITKLVSIKKVGNERTEFLNKSGNQNVFKRGLVSSNKATKISANIKSSKPVETIQGVNDIIINFSDVKPYGIAWMSMFRDNFIKETGNELDVEKITRGDLGYLKENKQAIKNASNKANTESADMFGSNNPFEKQIGILEAVSGKKDSKNILSSAFNRTKFFLSGFNIGALSSITTAINKFAETNDSRELRKAIGGSVRMLSYAPAVALITGSIWALLRGEDDDDKKMRGLLDDIRDDKDFLKSINEFLNYPVQKDEDGNPIEIKGDDLIKLEELKDKLLKDKRFKDAYDIYYGYVTRQIFEDDVRGETARINESGLNVDKSTIDVPMSKIRGGKYGLKDKEVVELLATIHSEKGRMLFDSEEDRADVISEIEDYLVKTQFFNKQVMIENFKYIDNQIVRNLSTIVSDYRNNTIEDDLVKEGLSFVSDLLLSRSNNMLKGGYNYLAEMGNKYKIQSEQGDRGYSYYKDQVFNPLFSYGLNKEFDKVQKKDIVFDALKVLNPTLGSSLSNDNFDLKTTSLMRLLRTTGTFGFNDFAKIKTRAENDVIYNSLRGKFTKNIVKDFSDAKLFMTKEEKEKKVNEDMQYISPIIQSKDRTYKVNGKSAN